MRKVAKSSLYLLFGLFFVGLSVAEVAGCTLVGEVAPPAGTVLTEVKVGIDSLLLGPSTKSAFGVVEKIFIDSAKNDSTVECGPS